MHFDPAPASAPDVVDVSVLVVTHNSAAVVGDLLRSLPDAAGGLRVRIVVADNGSSDGTGAAVMSAAPASRLVETGGNRGYAAGINVARSLAPRSRALLICNPDVRFQPGSIRRLFEQLRDGVGIAVPRLVDERGTVHASLRRDPTVLRALGEAVLGGRRAGRLTTFGETVVSRETYKTDGDVEWAVGAALLITAECFDVVGDWDESFFLYSEETDFALRARDAGFSIRYVADAVAVHKGGDLHRSNELWSIQTVNRVRLYRKRHGAGRTRLFWFAVFLNEAIRAVSGRTSSKTALRALLAVGPDLRADTSR